MSINSYKIKVTCFRDSFGNHCTVNIRSAMTPLGKIVEPVCEFFNAGFPECQSCRVHLQRIFMDENYMHDPSRILNPITGEAYPPADKHPKH